MLTFLATKGGKVFAGVVAGFAASGVGGYVVVSRMAPPVEIAAPAVEDAGGARVASRSAPRADQRRDAAAGRVAMRPETEPAAQDIEPGPGPAPVSDIAPASPSAAPSPSFDLVRVEADGEAVLAGRATPEAKVEVLLDGKVIASAVADSSGQFFAMANTGGAGALTLRATDDDGVRLSESSVIVLAPASSVAPGAAQAGLAGVAGDSAPQGRMRIAALEADAGRAALGGTLAAARKPDAGAPAEDTDAGSPPAGDAAAGSPPAGAVAKAPPPAVATAPTANAGTAPVAESAAKSGPTAKAPTEPPKPKPAEARIASERSAPEAGSGVPVAARSAADPGGGGVAPSAEAPAIVVAAAPAAPESSDAARVAPAAPDAAPVLLRAGPDGVELLQPPLAIPDMVTLDAITYSDLGEVVVSGRGAPGATARIYADGDALGDARISQDGYWELTLASLERPGAYTLRIDEIDRAGAVQSRVESPFQRADATRPAAGATRIVVQPGHNLWQIAETRYGEGARYTVIYAANRDRIRDPDLIYPGQIFELPK